MTDTLVHFDLLNTAQFALAPSTPVRVTRGNGTRYPGVQLSAFEAVPPQNVYVTIPRGAGLAPNKEGNPTYLITVQDGTTHATHTAPGVLLPDGHTLVFPGVDLLLAEQGAKSYAWVAVDASPEAPLGKTALKFQIGPVSSPSSEIDVVDDTAYRVTPAAPVQLKRDSTAYAGVEVTALEGSDVQPQDAYAVYVVIPPGRGLDPDLEGHPSYTLTVSDGKTSKYYSGELLPDGETLAFKAVTLGLAGPGTKVNVWVAIKARPDATLGDAQLAYKVGPVPSDSATITVVEK